MTPEQLVIEVARRIRDLRVARGLKQVELAERAGVSAVSLNRIERGRQEPSLGSLARLAAVLGVDPADLLPRPARARDAAGALDDLLPEDDAETARRLRRALRFLATGE